MPKPTVICLTPVKNEAWILHRFLKCASLWADHIIIADQFSNDGSREIARCYPKVILMDNPSQEYNEVERQKILLEAARNIPGPRLLIALDADEILSSNFMNSPEWNTIMQASTGTVVLLELANLLPDLHSYWLMSRGGSPVGFVDDGSEHFGQKIHSRRVPISAGSTRIIFHDIKVLHYQYTDWERMQSKHRWYQCWERLNHPEQHSISIYRKYHQMDYIPTHEIETIPKEWLSGYEKHGIDMTSTSRPGLFWWDEEVISWFAKYGCAKFKREAVWDVNWDALAKELNMDISQILLSDPRSRSDKYVHGWLKRTQATRKNFRVRMIEKVLRLVGW